MRGSRLLYTTLVSESSNMITFLSLNHHHQLMHLFIIHFSFELEYSLAI